MNSSAVVASVLGRNLASDWNNPEVKPDGMSEGPWAGAASGQADLGVLEEEGQFLGHSVQFGHVGMLQEVAASHEEVLQKVLPHTPVQLPCQAQEPFAEDLPVLRVGILLTSPKEHCLRKEEEGSDIAEATGESILRSTELT